MPALSQGFDSPHALLIDYGEDVKKKPMSRTKMMRHLREIRSLLYRMYTNGNIRGAITDHDQALTEAIKMVKLNRQVILPETEDEFGDFK